jgi:plasmid maintenance system antidote protein VapI
VKPLSLLDSTLDDLKGCPASLGVSQARVSDLINGKFNKFSLDMLAKLAERAGLHAASRRHDAPTKLWPL